MLHFRSSLRFRSVALFLATGSSVQLLWRPDRMILAKSCGKEIRNYNFMEKGSIRTMSIDALTNYGIIEQNS
jgi:hypothetical protein